MNINHTALRENIDQQTGTVVALLVKALEKSGEHGRASSVGVSYKIKRNKKTGKWGLRSVAKYKAPAAPKVDTSGSTDEELFGAWDADEEQGQQRIDD